MKKIIGLLCLLILSGCSVEYNVYLGENEIDDNLLLYTTNDKAELLDEKETASFLMDFERDYEKYQKKYVNYSKDKVGYYYNASHTYDLYDIESRASYCYKNVNISRVNGYKISTSNEFYCMNYNDELDKVKISLSSYYEVIKTNCDYEEDGKYIWEITKQNYKNKPIIVELSTEKAKVNYNSTYITFGICGGILVLIIAVYLVLKKRETY